MSPNHFALSVADIARVRDLLTDEGYPLHPEEWVDHREIRDDGSLLVTLFGPKSREQALEILESNVPRLAVERLGDDKIIVRRRCHCP